MPKLIVCQCMYWNTDTLKDQLVCTGLATQEDLLCDNCRDSYQCAQERTNREVRNNDNSDGKVYAEDTNGPTYSTRINRLYADSVDYGDSVRASYSTDGI